MLYLSPGYCLQQKVKIQALTEEGVLMRKRLEQQQQDHEVALQKQRELVHLEFVKEQQTQHSHTEQMVVRYAFCFNVILIHKHFVIIHIYIQKRNVIKTLSNFPQTPPINITIFPLYQYMCSLHSMRANLESTAQKLNASNANLTVLENENSKLRDDMRQLQEDKATCGILFLFCLFVFAALN
jgi:hypothetical protein